MNEAPWSRAPRGRCGPPRTPAAPAGEKGAAIATDLLPLRTEAITRVYLGMQQIQKNLAQVTIALNAKTLPASLIGTLEQPGGANAARLQVGFDPGSVGNDAPPATFVTGDDGHFQLDVPPNTTLPDAGITLSVHGANASANLAVPAQRIATNGLIGSLQLDQTIAPLPVSILAALEAIVPVTPPSSATTQPTKASLPTVKIGDDGPCGIEFNANPSVDVFPYGVFFRLVEPRLSIVHPIFRFPLGDKFLPVQVFETAFKTISFGETTSYVDRVPVEQPLRVGDARANPRGNTRRGRPDHAARMDQHHSSHDGAGDERPAGRSGAADHSAHLLCAERFRDIDERSAHLSAPARVHASVSQFGAAPTGGIAGRDAAGGCAAVPGTHAGYRLRQPPSPTRPPIPSRW